MQLSFTNTDRMIKMYWDEPPLQIFTCEVCDGRGYTLHRVTVYEHGCGFPRDDTDERPCERCHGYGEFIDDAEGYEERRERGP